MRIVPVASIANQSVSAQLDGIRYVLRLTETAGVMSVDIERAGVAIVTGQRVVAGEPLIPYEYLEDGNFIFTVVGDELPDWRKFNTSQQLVFLTNAEIEALK